MSKSVDVCGKDPLALRRRDSSASGWLAALASRIAPPAGYARAEAMGTGSDRGSREESAEN